MPTNFFEKEIEKVRERFNQTFGNRTTCSIKLRQAVILQICGMGCLKNKIQNAADTAKVKTEIGQFIKIRNALNNIFDTIENHNSERRYVENDQRTPKQRRNYHR